MKVISVRAVALSVVALLVFRGKALGQQPLGDSRDVYRILATAESDDQVALIEFRPCLDGATANCGATVVRTYQVGLLPADTEGPHGVVMAPDGKSFYVSLAHGRPFGYLQKIDFATGRPIGLVEVGMFAATVDLAAGELIWVVNFNFEDPKMEPSSVSIVDGQSMMEVARPTTCRMPHGSRLNGQGTKHYSGCMMNDLLVEIDARTFEVTKKFSLAPGREGVVSLDAGGAAGEHGDMAGMSHGDHPTTAVSNLCSPTWAQPAAAGPSVYVACNRSNEIVEIDTATWALLRRWKTPAAPYNLAVTPDGSKLIATQKGPGTITVWRLRDQVLLGEIAGTRKVASGVAVSADSRYAFVTLEGVGGQPGTVDVVDLATVTKVGSVAMGKQAGGVTVVP